MFADSASAYVYWTNWDTGTIGRANPDGTGVNQSFVSGFTHPAALAADAGYIYWGSSDASRIWRANLDDTGVNPAFVTTTNPAIDGIAVDIGHLYWSDYNYSPACRCGVGTTLGRSNIDGSGVTQPFVSGASGPSGVAVDGAYVYWVNWTSSTIGRANLDGTGVNASFITGASYPQDLVVDAGPPPPPPPPPPAPHTTITSGPTPITHSRTPAFTLVGNHEPDQTFECRIDTDAFTSCASPYTSQPLPDGLHIFQVRGNYHGSVEAQAATWSFSVDTAPTHPGVTGGPGTGGPDSGTPGLLQPPPAKASATVPSKPGPRLRRGWLQ
jgi:hypothetical protein